MVTQRSPNYTCTLILGYVGGPQNNILGHLTQNVVVRTSADTSTQSFSQGLPIDKPRKRTEGPLIWRIPGYTEPPGPEIPNSEPQYPSMSSPDETHSRKPDTLCSFKTMVLKKQSSFGNMANFFPHPPREYCHDPSSIEFYCCEKQFSMTPLTTMTS